MQLSLDAAMERTFSVAELGQLLADVLSHTFPHDLWVQGEVRDLVRAQSGHVYFTLVDPANTPGQRPDAALSVVLFESTKRTVNAQIKRSGGGMRIADGIAVRLRGQPDFYVPQGKLSLRMTGIDPSYTIGQLAASRDRLLQVLADEGLLGKNRAIPFPRVPLEVGLVTAGGSAAHADFVDELARGRIAFRVRLASTPVQGAGAPARIAASIRACAAAGVDVIAVVRGGGAKTDLVAFDDEVVARAIAGCPVPVLTGIGHEIDTSVADQVAQVSLKTPTACAAYLVEAALAAEAATAALWHGIAATAARRLAGCDDSLTRASVDVRAHARRALREADRSTAGAAHRVRALVASQLDRAEHRLAKHLTAAGILARHRLAGAAAGADRAAVRLDAASRRRLDAAARRVDAADVRARLLDPARVLARGWSITTGADGSIVRSTAEAPPGTKLTTRVADGHIASTVDPDPGGPPS